MTTKIQKLCRLMAQNHRLDQQTRKVREAKEKLTGKAGFGWSVGTCSDGKVGVTTRITLADYLSQFPSVSPVVRTWNNSEKGQMQYMLYPAQFVGTFSGIHTFIEAETESVCVRPLDADTVQPIEPLASCTPEVAAAFGLESMPSHLLAVEAV